MAKYEPELDETQEMDPITEESETFTPMEETNPAEDGPNKYDPEAPEATPEISEELSFLDRFREGGLRDVNLLDSAITSGRKDLVKHRDAIDAAVALVPDDKRALRLTKFKETYEESRYLDTATLKEAVVQHDLHGAARPVRDALWKALKAVPHA